MNYQPEHLVSQGFVYSCQHPVIDDLLESFPVSDDSVLNCSKPTNTNSLLETQPGGLVMVQTAAYDIPSVGSSLKSTRSAKIKSTIDVKPYCASDIDTFFGDAPIVNHVTDLSKHINTVEAAYSAVQSQPMQLTLDNSARPVNCVKSIGKKLPQKVNAVESTDKAYNSAMFVSWIHADQISSSDRPNMYELPQTQPLQLTHVNSELPQNGSSIKRTKKKTMPTVDGGEKTHKCSYCSKVLSSSSHLKDHLLIHTGERPFSCGECGFSVSKKSNLKAHQRIHSGERPFMCGICFKMFGQTAHLTSHMVTHTGEKRCECSHCNIFFSSKSNLDQHMNKQHGGELKQACDICDEKFSCKSWLQVHLRVHSQKRPYQCDVCKKRFKDKFYIAKHKKKFCGNEGYAKRWEQPGVKKPPGRKRKLKPQDQDGLAKRKRGRPKCSHKKRKRQSKRRYIDDDMEENAVVQPADSVPIDENVPLALNTTSASIANQTVEYGGQKIRSHGDRKNEGVFPNCDIENFHSNPRQLLPENCEESNILELDLSAETILDFTKQDSQALQQCFAEPQNLSSSSSSLKHSNECGEVSMGGNNSHFSSYTPDVNVYAQPQNLSMHQQMSHAIETVEPQNLSHPQKFNSNSLWDLSNIKPEDLTEPQNLSLTIEPQNLSIQNSLTQPQNLSLGQLMQQPQNLSHAGSISNNMHNAHINPHVHNLSSGIINTSNCLSDPNNFTHSQDFAQPQNLTIDQNSLGHNSYHTQTQPQNLSYSTII